MPITLVLRKITSRNYQVNVNRLSLCLGSHSCYISRPTWCPVVLMSTTILVFFFKISLWKRVKGSQSQTLQAGHFAPSFAFGFLFSFVYDLTLSVGRTCICNKRKKSIVSVGIWVCVLRKSLVFLDNIGYLYIIPCFYES